MAAATRDRTQRCRDCEARAHANTVVGRHTWDAASLSAHAPRLRDGGGGGGKAHCEETTCRWRGSGRQGGEGARARRGWARTYRRHARGARPGRSCPRSNREKRPRARGPSRNSRGLLRPSPRRFRALADSECFAPPDETSMRTSAASISAFVPARPGFGALRELEPVSATHPRSCPELLVFCEGMQRGPHNVSGSSWCHQSTHTEGVAGGDRAR